MDHWYNLHSRPTPEEDMGSQVPSSSTTGPGPEVEGWGELPVWVGVSLSLLTLGEGTDIPTQGLEAAGIIWVSLRAARSSAQPNFWIGTGTTANDMEVEVVSSLSTLTSRASTGGYTNSGSYIPIPNRPASDTVGTQHPVQDFFNTLIGRCKKCAYWARVYYP